MNLLLQNRHGRCPLGHSVTSLLLLSMRVVYSKDPDGGTRTTTDARKHGRAVQSGRSLVAFASTASCMPLGKVLFVRSAYATSSTSQPAANLHAAVSSASDEKYVLVRCLWSRGEMLALFGQFMGRHDHLCSHPIARAQHLAYRTGMRIVGRGRRAALYRPG